MAVQIRKFVEDDLPQLVRLLNATYEDSYEFAPFTEEKLRSWIKEAKLKILMAEEDRGVLGSAAYNDGHWGEEIVWLIASGTLNRKLIEKILVEQAERLVVKGAVFAAVDAGSQKNRRVDRTRVQRGKRAVSYGCKARRHQACSSGPPKTSCLGV